MRKILLILAASAVGALCASAQTSEEKLENGHQYVDLGLPSGLMWSDRAIGAVGPVDKGDYFAWGETEPKNEFTTANYKFGPLGSYEEIYKYNREDGKTVLDPEDDAACVQWGGRWRMPTKDECLELEKECTWTLTEHLGVSTYKVEGPNGNYIYLHLCGYFYDKLRDYQRTGYYLSSSVFTGTSNFINITHAYIIKVNPRFFSGHSSNRRYCGSLVRPVFNPVSEVDDITDRGHRTAPTAKEGRVYCSGDFRIYDLAGRDVTKANGSLKGVYIVKADGFAGKIAVR